MIMYRVNEIKDRDHRIYSANYLIMDKRNFTSDDSLVCEIQDIDTEERRLVSFNEMYDLFKKDELVFQVDYKNWYIVTISTLTGARLASSVNYMGTVPLYEFRNSLSRESVASFDDWYQSVDNILSSCDDNSYLKSLDLCAPSIYGHRHDGGFASTLYLNYTSPFNADEAEARRGKGVPLSFFTNLIDFYFLNRNKFFLCGTSLVLKADNQELYCFDVSMKFLIEVM